MHFGHPARTSALLPPPLWPPLLATRAPGGRSEAHAHHALHLVVALEGGLRFRAKARDRWTPAAGVLTAPDVPHALDAEGAEILLVFFDPESDAGARLHSTVAHGIRAITEAERDALVVHADPLAWMGPEGPARTEDAIRILGAEPRPLPRLHPRVRRVVRHLREGEAADVSLEALAQHAGLSPGRLMHAFTESIGIPLRPYLTWLKLQRAAAAIVSGAPVGQAAHEAGFADAAHLSRAFRRAFGMPPSAIRPASRRQPVGSSAQAARRRMSGP